MQYKGVHRSDQRIRINKSFIQRYVHILVIHSYNTWQCKYLRLYRVLGEQRWLRCWLTCRKTRVTQNIAAMMTGHGKTRAYFHRFKILENATCAYGQGDQTINHLLYHCSLLE